MGASRKVARASPVSEIKRRHGAYLPHWTRDNAWYAVTFRLWDSLPRPIVESWLFERRNIVKAAEQMKRPLSDREERRLAHLYSEKVECYLDAGLGSCYMKDKRVARHSLRTLCTISRDHAIHSRRVRDAQSRPCRGSTICGEND